MKTILCTLFNHYYLDKGLVLYDSLKEVSKDFRIYILCMDDRCFEILTDINYPEIVPIKLSNFEDDIMIEAKGNRTFGEYCWTCSSSLILYVLESYEEPICTYIDADMFFYQDPEILINEMRKAEKTVMITPHRFPPINKSMEVNGLYCVEFNTFVNEGNSLKVLRKWKSDCLKCCTAVNDGVHFGDQKYLDTWPQEYPDTVHVCEHPGAGIAPWNIGFYKNLDSNNTVFYKKDNRNIPIVFYHYAGISYSFRNKVVSGVRDNIDIIDYKLVDGLYKDYLYKLDEKKIFLQTKYGVKFLMLSHPAFNKHKGLKAFLRKFGILRLIKSKLMPNKSLNYVVELNCPKFY